MAHLSGGAVDTIHAVAEQTIEQSLDDQSDERPSSEKAQSPGSSRIAPVALVVALAAVGLAVFALLRPAGGPEPAPAAVDASAEQGSKADVCGAFQTVRSAVSIQTHATSEGPAGAQAVAANARLSMLGGGAYLLERTGPATPPELADAIQKFAGGLQDIAMHSLTGIGNDDPQQAERLRNADAANKSIADICAAP